MSLWCVPRTQLPLMSQFPPNAHEYVAGTAKKTLQKQAFLVIARGEPFEVCNSFEEAVSVLREELEEDEMVVREGSPLGVYYGNSNITAWVSVVPLDQIDELGLLYLP